MIQNGTNTNSTSCACLTGYENDQTTGDCIDINECELGTHKCVDNICYNLGSFLTGIRFSLIVRFRLIIKMASSDGSYRCKTIVDVVWAIDGTGSYKTHRNQVFYIINFLTKFHLNMF